MTQVERVLRMTEFGYFDFSGPGTDLRAAEDALETAVIAGHDQPANGDSRPQGFT